MKRIFFSKDETPIIRLIHDTFHNDTLNDLDSGFFKKWGHANKWACFSDYSFDKRKANDVITFTFFPYVAAFDELGLAIKQLAPKEIKNTRTVNRNFLKFIRVTPFLSFSVILSNHKHMFFSNREKLKESMIFSVDRLIDSIPGWVAQYPHMAEHYEETYRKKLLDIRRLIIHDRKISILKNIFLVTSIGSILSTMICNITSTEAFGWFSDRDEINDICENFSHYLFHAQFTQHVLNENCKFLVAPAMSTSDEWYKDIVKVPDYLTGAIADYNFATDQTTHKKFDTILRDFVADNSYNFFVYELNLGAGNAPTCSRIVLRRNT